MQEFWAAGALIPGGRWCAGRLHHLCLPGVQRLEVGNERLQVLLHQGKNSSEHPSASCSATLHLRGQLCQAGGKRSGTRLGAGGHLKAAGTGVKYTPTSRDAGPFLLGTTHLCRAPTLLGAPESVPKSFPSNMQQNGGSRAGPGAALTSPFRERLDTFFSILAAVFSAPRPFFSRRPFLPISPLARLRHRSPRAGNASRVGGTT